MTLPRGVLSSKADAVHDLAACLPPRSEGPQRPRETRSQLCSQLSAAHLYGGFLGTSKNLVPVKQAEDNRPVVENHDTDKLERAECISAGFLRGYAHRPSDPHTPSPPGSYLLHCSVIYVAAKYTNMRRTRKL